MDDVEPEESKTAGKKRKLSKAAIQKLKAKEKAKANKKKKKGDDDNYSDSEEDEYTALSKNGFTLTGKSHVLPPVGNFEDCATCGKQFTVVCFLFTSHRSTLTQNSDTIHHGVKLWRRLPVQSVC